MLNKSVGGWILDFCFHCVFLRCRYCVMGNTEANGCGRRLGVSDPYKLIQISHNVPYLFFFPLSSFLFLLSSFFLLPSFFLPSILPSYTPPSIPPWTPELDTLPTSLNPHTLPLYERARERVPYLEPLLLLNVEVKFGVLDVWTGF